ncbi:hypothetical protein U1Q18_049136 [Sarracenia purpurea var. burkii]
MVTVATLEIGGAAGGRPRKPASTPMDSSGGSVKGQRNQVNRAYPDKYWRCFAASIKLGHAIPCQDIEPVLGRLLTLADLRKECPM